MKKSLNSVFQVYGPYFQIYSKDNHIFVLLAQIALPIKLRYSYVSFELILVYFRYPHQYYRTRVNYFSTSDSSVTYDGTPTGDISRDNARVLREKRFVMAAIGNEFRECPNLGNLFKLDQRVRIQILV